MPIPEDHSTEYRRDGKNEELDQRVEEFHSRMEGSPTHDYWYDRHFWHDVVKEYCSLVMFQEELDDIIHSDPHADIAHLEKMSTSTANRIKDLRGRLGIDASKMRMLRPKEKARKSFMESIEDAGFEGA